MDGYKTYNPETEGFGSTEQWRSAFNKRMSIDEAEQVLGSNDPLTILGLKANATGDAVKKAFRKMAMQYHPDKNVGNESEAKVKMQEVLAAYTVLKKKLKIK